MQPADRTVAALVVGAVGYEGVALARGWELISEAFNRYRARWWRRALIDSCLYLLVLHLTRRIPRRFDPLARIADSLSRRHR